MSLGIRVAIEGLTVTAETLGSLLRGKKTIAVPIYQRHYSWETKQIDTLIEDLLTELRKPMKDDRTLFLGTIVFNTETADGEKTTDLIDGQQRLFTLSLIQLYWVSRLARINTGRSGAVRFQLSQLIFNDHVDDPAALTGEQLRRLMRLNPSLHDRNNYESLLTRGKGAHRGRSRLVSAYKAIEERFDLYLRNSAKEAGVPIESDEPSFLEFVVAIADQINDLISQRISFAVIDVAPPFNAFGVFESLNSKGLELAQSDLIKNFLLKQLGSDHLRKDALLKWDRMVAAVPGERVVDFLRAWYIAYNRHVQRSGLYDAFRSLLNSKQRIKECLDDWNRCAWWYRAFVDGRISDNHDELSGTRIEPQLQRALSNWAELGFKQGIPILLAACHPDVCKPTERAGQLRLVEIARVLETAYVRLFVSGNVRGSVFENRLERMCELARTVRQGASSELLAIVTTLCEDQQLAGDLDWSNVSRPTREARYLLYRIAEHQVGNAVHLAGSDKWHVEHISPQTPSEQFVDEREAEEYSDLVNKIGNLTLLLEGDNTSLGNKAYSDKIEVFRAYDGQSAAPPEAGLDGARRPRLALNLDMATQWPREWDEEAISQRGALLGRYASKVWPLKNQR